MERRDLATMGSSHNRHGSSTCQLLGTKRCVAIWIAAHHSHCLYAQGNGGRIGSASADVEVAGAEKLPEEAENSNSSVADADERSRRFVVKVPEGAKAGDKVTVSHRGHEFSVPVSNARLNRICSSIYLSPLALLCFKALRSCQTLLQQSFLFIRILSHPLAVELTARYCAGACKFGCW